MPDRGGFQPLVEPAGVVDTFASDVGRVELLGSNVRLVFFVESAAEEGAAPDRVVVAKLILPIDAIPMAFQRTLFALGIKEIADYPIPGVTKIQ